MWCRETLKKLNAWADTPPERHPLRYHPRILALRKFVKGLPVSPDYKHQLVRNIYVLAEEIVSRPVYAPGEGWSDEEALQQYTLAQIFEKNIQCLIQ